MTVKSPRTDFFRISCYFFPVETNRKVDEEKSLLSWWSAERSILERSSCPGKCLLLAYLFRDVTTSTLTSNAVDMVNLSVTVCVTVKSRT